MSGGLRGLLGLSIAFGVACGGAGGLEPDASGGAISSAGGLRATVGGSGTTGTGGRVTTSFGGSERGLGGQPSAGGALGLGGQGGSGGVSGGRDPTDGGGAGGTDGGGADAGGAGGASATGGGGGADGGGAGGEPGTCGNLILDPGEACDDDNIQDVDGCNHLCQVEPGWSCPPLGSCESVPGNVPCPSNSCRLGSGCITNTSHIACDCPSSPLPTCAAPAFRSLPLLPEGLWCRGQALNHDATTVVGSCNVSINGYAVAWRAAGSSAVEKIGLGEPYDGGASGVSGDGNLAVGGPESYERPGFIYDFSATPKATAFTAGHPYGISADGRVILASSMNNETIDEFLWTASGSVEISYGAYSSHMFTGLSADGDVLVGDVYDGSATHAARWNAAGVLELLQLPDGATSSTAAAVSADGTSIVGTIWTGFDARAVRWTETGPEALGDLANQFAESRAMSADGTRVLGRERAGDWVVWDQTNGKRKLKTILTDAGVDLTEWVVLDFIAMSGDGTHVLGQARYLGPEHPNRDKSHAFLLRLP